MQSLQRWAIVIDEQTSGRGASFGSAPDQSVPCGVPALQAALTRLRPIVPRARTCVVVPRERWANWQSLTWAVGSGRLIVEPVQRGSGISLLLALLTIERIAPGAVVLGMPIYTEASTHALDDALIYAVAEQRAVLLVGPARSRATPLDYVLVGRELSGGGPEVKEFLTHITTGERQNPGEPLLASTSVLAGNCEALIDLFECRFPEIVHSLRRAAADATGQLERLLEQLPAIDLANDILEPCAERLRALSIRERDSLDTATPATRPWRRRTDRHFHLEFAGQGRQDQNGDAP